MLQLRAKITTLLKSEVSTYPIKRYRIRVYPLVTTLDPHSDRIENRRFKTHKGLARLFIVNLLAFINDIVVTSIHTVG